MLEAYPNVAGEKGKKEEGKCPFQSEKKSVGVSQLLRHSELKTVRACQIKARDMMAVLKKKHNSISVTYSSKKISPTFSNDWYSNLFIRPNNSRDSFILVPYTTRISTYMLYVRRVVLILSIIHPTYS